MKVSAYRCKRMPGVSPTRRFGCLLTGEQHDLTQTVSLFAMAFRVPDGYITGLVEEVERRLPRAVVRLPVNIAGRGSITLRVSSLADLDRTIEIFCEVADVPLENVPVLRQKVLGTLNPDAVVMPGRRATAP
jgi:hypothetical protein